MVSELVTRTARFLEDFITNENFFVEYLFVMLNVIWIKFFKMYSDDIVSTCNLRIVLSVIWFFW